MGNNPYVYGIFSCISPSCSVLFEVIIGNSINNVGVIIIFFGLNNMEGE